MKIFGLGSIALGAVCALAAPALSVPTFYIVQKDARYTQSGASTVTLAGFQFLGRATPNDGVGPIDFDGGTISFPAASSLATSALGPSGAELRYNSGIVDQTTFQTNYPDGIYNFHLTDSANAAHTENASVDSSIAPVPTAIPALSAASFNGLQGMNPAQPFTVNFNAFTGANANALIFFAITDAGGSTILFDGLQPNVTQDTIAANTLQLGQQYNFFLFFSNAAITAANNGEVLQENRTNGSFATAPEPSSAALCMLGIAVFALRRTRILAR
jgi:hypothetical protein